MKNKSYLTEQEARNIVFDYKPKTFPVVVSAPAQGFVNHQSTNVTDFNISELIAKQSGIHEVSRQSIDKKVNELALERLKEVEEKAYNEAYELGLIEGSEKAFKERQTELEERLEILDNYIRAFEDVKNQLLEQNEIFIVKTILEIAKKIAMVEIAENKELILSVISNIIQEVQADDKFVLHTSPDDYIFLSQLIEKASKEFSYLSNAKIEIDDGVTTGGCVLETNFGSIDATVEQRIEKAWAAISGRLPKLIGHKIHLKEVQSVGTNSGNENTVGTSENGQTSNGVKAESEPDEKDTSEHQAPSVGDDSNESED